MREFDLIAKIRERIGALSSSVCLGPGDDSAVVTTGTRTCLSVDAAVEGVHFDLGTLKPWAVGRRAMAAALSDLAAMGAEPRYALVDLGVRSGVSEFQMMSLVDGLIDECKANHVDLVGGNLTSSRALFVSTTVVGNIEGDPLLRSGARPGDLLLVSGVVGGASLAITILKQGGCLEESVEAGLCKSHLLFTPRIALGLALRPIASAAIDVSDGLLQDLRHLVEASNAGARLFMEQVPRPQSFDDLASKYGNPNDFLLGGGEDYELLVTVPPDRLDEAVKAASSVSVPLGQIGVIVDSSQGVVILDASGRPTAHPGEGWDHFFNGRG